MPNNFLTWGFEECNVNVLHGSVIKLVSDPGDQCIDVVSVCITASHCVLEPNVTLLHFVRVVDHYCLCKNTFVID